VVGHGGLEPHSYALPRIRYKCINLNSDCGLQGGKTRFGRSRGTVDPGRLRVLGRGFRNASRGLTLTGPAISLRGLVSQSKPT
jgi:hypothetical protein